MSIASEIARLQAAKVDIMAALVEKGVDVTGKNLVDVPDLIDGIQTDTVQIGENIYNTVTINGLTWTKTNLREKTGTYKTITNDPQYTIDRYGYLYTYNSKSSLESLLPEGWRLPTGKDWMNLINYSGGNETGNQKVKATTDWETTSGAKIGTDDFGFSLLPASTDGSGLRTYVWSIPDSTRSQNRFSVDWDGTYFFWYNSSQSNYFVWRAVKDA